MRGFACNETGKGWWEGEPTYIGIQRTPVRGRELRRCRAEVDVKKREQDVEDDENGGGRGQDGGTGEVAVLSDI